jgi:hypothetical protein
MKLQQQQGSTFCLEQEQCQQRTQIKGSTVKQQHLQNILATLSLLCLARPANTITCQ